MAIEMFIKNAFTKAFNKYFYNELIVGKLAHIDVATGKNKGDEIDVVMPGMVNVFDYDGADLPDAELVTTSVTKVKLDKGAAVHFGLKQVEEDMIKNAPSEEDQVELVKNYTDDAIKQIAARVDSGFAKLYTRAGHSVDCTSATFSAKIAKELFGYMQAKFQKGDGKGHTNWVDGQMIAIVPPEYQYYLGKLDNFYQGVESGHRKIEKGFIGKLYGWDILVSNNLHRGADDSVYPLFGIKGKTLAGGMIKDLHMQDYIPEKSFDRKYKGYSLYGMGAPRSDYFGTAKIKAPLQMDLT